MLLVLRERIFRFRRHQVIEHELAKPKNDEFGPDLTFIEITPGEHLQNVLAVCSVWSLDRQSSELIETFSSFGTPLAMIGYPEREGEVLKHSLDVKIGHTHKTLLNVIEENSISTRGEWDYVFLRNTDSEKYPLPPTFAGFSGGPIWGMQFGFDKSTGRYKILKSALVGLTFYQTDMIEGERFVRGHFIKSLYDTAWRDFPSN